MKINLSTIAVLLVITFKSGLVQAQQDPYVTHYMFNRMLYNPAAAGTKQRFCLTAMTHYQYVGFEDRTPEFHPATGVSNGQYGEPTKNVGPKTQMFSFSAPVTKYGGLGIGFIKDKLGYESNTHIKIDAAGRLPLGDEKELALGFEVNFLQKGLNGAMLKPLAPLDPSIPSNNVTQTHPVFGAGLYYSNAMTNNGSWKDMWGGVSALTLNSPTYTFTANNNSTLTFSTPKTHIYAMGGISKLDFLGNSNLVFHPSVMLKQNTVWQLDATALVEYQSKLWGGLAYRTTTDAMSVMLGYSGFNGNFKGLRVGYSYDLTLSRILNVSSGTHELQLNYCFVVEIVEKAPVIIVTPPFMHRESD